MDLIAVHNLDEEKLLADINELGGFLAPSIANIRQEWIARGMEISLSCSQKTIDPYNRVYGGDGWTPTSPSVEYGIDDDAFIKSLDSSALSKTRCHHSLTMRRSEATTIVPEISSIPAWTAS